MFQHTAARRRLIKAIEAMVNELVVSTHSRPKAAALIFIKKNRLLMFQHTAARRRLFDKGIPPFMLDSFQHTAARRRLQNVNTGRVLVIRFNTQPPEGGWLSRQAAQTK